MLNRPRLRVAVLCSRRAPGLEYVLAHAGERGWRVVCCVTSEDVCAGEDVVRPHGLPMIYHPVRSFYARHQAALNDLAIREAYDRRTVEMLADHQPDVVLLAGYLLLLTAPMLDAFGGCILNVHHSDLR